MIKKIVNFKLGLVARLLMIAGVISITAIIKYSSLGEGLINRLTAGYGIFDLHMYYDNNTINSILEMLGSAGRTHYTRLLLLDFAFSCCFAFTFAWVFQFVMGKGIYSGKIKNLVLIPYLRGLMDWLENIVLMVIMIAFPGKIPVLANVAGFITFTKWALMILTFLVPIILAVNNIVRKRKADSMISGT